MSDDMSDMIQKMSEMLKNNEIPDNVKMVMNNLASQTNSDSSSHNSSSNAEGCTTEERFQDILNSFANMNSQNNNNGEGSQSNFNETNSNSSSDMPNIDLNTMLKMKSIIDAMHKQQNDPRANLLRSLKPYLKPSRKDKVEQYIKLFSMGKMFEVLNPLGGEKKNDV